MVPIGTPSRSAAIWAKAVSWPWPLDSVPTATVTRPSLSKRTSAPSLGRATRGLEEAGDANAEQPATHLGGGAPRRDVGRVGARHGSIEIGDEAAGIDRHAERRAVRKAGDQILPSQLGRIATELAGGSLDAALDDVVGLGLAGAAIGIDRARCW